MVRLCELGARDKWLTDLGFPLSRKCILMTGSDIVSVRETDSGAHARGAGNADVGSKGRSSMIDEAKTTASCAMINRHGEVVTWHARGDGICYVSDSPPSLDWIGVALAVGLIMIVILSGLRSIRWIASKFWREPRVTLYQRSFTTPRSIAVRRTFSTTIPKL